MNSIGLIAGNGRLPFLFADAAKAQGLSVHAVAFQGEADDDLHAHVRSLSWVKVGQADGIVRALKKHGVTKAVMAGGIGRIRSLTQARPDLGMLKIAAGLRSLRDDELLRAVATYFERQGVQIVAPTDYVKSVLAQRRAPGGTAAHRRPSAATSRWAAKSPPPSAAPTWARRWW